MISSPSSNGDILRGRTGVPAAVLGFLVQSPPQSLGHTAHTAHHGFNTWPRVCAPGQPVVPRYVWWCGGDTVSTSSNCRSLALHQILAIGLQG